MGQAISQSKLSAAIQQKLAEFGYDDLARFPVDPFMMAAKEGLEVVKVPLGGLGGVLLRRKHLARVFLAEEEPARWTFTLMHELIHYWFHPGATYYEAPGVTRDIYEIQANHGAAEALMPAWAVREVAPMLDFDAGRLAHAFGVSRQAMEIRLEELRLSR